MLDSRLNLLASSSNPKVHEYYRVYFDKPSRKKQDRILLKNALKDSYPNLRSTLEKFSDRLPKNKESKKLVKMRESNWDANFHIKVSKDNQKYYKDCREFFDSPMAYDPKSTLRGSIRNPLLNYVEKTKKAESKEKFFWSSLYEPISERNLFRHRSQRVYFS